jgi:hypothetical protein
MSYDAPHPHVFSTAESMRAVAPKGSAKRSVAVSNMCERAASCAGRSRRAPRLSTRAEKLVRGLEDGLYSGPPEYTLLRPPGDVDTNDANERGEPGRCSALFGVRAGRSGSTVGAAAAIAAAVGFIRTAIATDSTATAAAPQPAAGAAIRSTTSVARSGVSATPVSAAAVSAITRGNCAWLRGAQWSVLP